MPTASVTDFLEDTLKKCGGLGRFQWMIIASVLGGKVSVTWSMLMMSFGGAIPNWSCQWGNQSSFTVDIHGTDNTCSAPSNYSDLICVRKTFDPSLHTGVSEWDLVCDRDWITQTITTIQMGGLLFGGLVAGQIADMFGRKPTYFLSMLMLFVFNLVAAFSTSWKMFAVLRFLIGIGCGFYLTVFFTFTIEFISGKYRPMLIAIPSWPIYAAAFGGMVCLIHDWMYLHIATAVATLPWLFTWWIIPESFRWLVANYKVDRAKKIIERMARINKKPVPDLSKIDFLSKSISNDGKKYTIGDVLKNRDLLKKTVLLGVGW
ncbi:MFS transporter, OCT family, solute carrier family 22 (organic cation transporter), member 4/5 [Mytilus galloprovincialis]|uniref:MFS transporter, OCT family, solute carrier family 22 (Organic cation transporter), member 4/5 n=1 Tax=Mytilus galloprovincialis TaxID=29158 RepID=A0A8B6G8V8_MYTGA|nr:MFS transporter, OCT family, solute carrier family 22 (organic cation transporter), member 4/5 [Mytilus galloprovincialis]